MADGEFYVRFVSQADMEDRRKESGPSGIVPKLISELSSAHAFDTDSALCQ
jgi:hypothetical protein